MFYCVICDGPADLFDSGIPKCFFLLFPIPKEALIDKFSFNSICLCSSCLNNLKTIECYLKKIEEIKNSLKILISRTARKIQNKDHISCFIYKELQLKELSDSDPSNIPVSEQIEDLLYGFEDDSSFIDCYKDDFEEKFEPANINIKDVKKDLNSIIIETNSHSNNIKLLKEEAKSRICSISLRRINLGDIRKFSPKKSKQTRKPRNEIDDFVPSDLTDFDEPNEENNFPRRRRRTKNSTPTSCKERQRYRNGTRPLDDLKCFECDKTFALPSLLKNHNAAVHEKKFNCEICGKSFSNQANNLIHLRHKHLKETKFPCDLCDFVTYSKNYLTQHVNLYHKVSEAERSCKICHKIFRCMKTLKGHMFRIHQTPIDSKPVEKCDLCEFTHFHKSAVMSHMKAKHGEKQYKCEFEGCGKMFKMKNQLKQHGVKHSTVLTCFCHICGRGYKSTARLRKHIVRFHERLNK